MRVRHYLVQGDSVNSKLSAVSLIPMACAVAALGKIMSKSDRLVKGVLKYGDDLVEGVAKYGDEVAEGLANHSDEASAVLTGMPKSSLTSSTLFACKKLLACPHYTDEKPIQQQEMRLLCSMA